MKVCFPIGAEDICVLVRREKKAEKALRHVIVTSPDLDHGS